MKNILKQNEWVSLMEIKEPDLGVDGYVYSHETRCQGRIVAILPFRFINRFNFEYLLKNEMTPCWGLEKQLSAITGGWEGGDIRDDAVRELLEETGYSITKDELIDLGTSYASKSSDTIYSLFAVNLTDKKQGEAIGDGSRVEAESESVWLDYYRLVDIQDPQVNMMYCRLMNQSYKEQNDKKKGN